METVMQTVLVDIYNLCHRNKNLVRKNITPSQSASSCSIGTVVSRQSSTSSDMNEPFSYDDVFHPEEVHNEVTSVIVLGYGSCVLLDMMPTNILLS